MKITEKEKHNRDELFNLMRENPELPVIPMVDGEIVAGDDFSYWMGSWGEARVDEVAIDEWDCEGRILTKTYGEEELIEDIAEIKYDGSDEAYEKAKEDAKSLWQKVIVVYIGLPDPDMWKSGKEM